MLAGADGDINDFDKDIMKKRIGKDLVTRVTILTDGEATALAGRDLTLELHHNTLSLAYQLAFTIENTNGIVFTWYGKTQEKTGSYTLTLWENKGKVGMTAIDIPYVELVSWTYAEVGNTGDTPSTSSVNLGSANLETTGRGYSAYECWLQAGHTGTMENFFDYLKGAQGDPGEKGDSGEGVPTGGSTGQVLAKKSSADYDTEWVDPAVGNSEFVGIWNCITGKPTTDPASLPYTYKAGDYYRVGQVADGYTHTVSMSGNDYNGNAYSVSFSITDSVSTQYSSVQALIGALYNAGHIAHSGTCPAIGTITDHETLEVRTLGYVAADGTNGLLLQDSITSAIGFILSDAVATITDTVSGGSTNYKPNGSSYTGVASTTVESDDVKIGWVYYYDGTGWLAQTAKATGLPDYPAADGTYELRCTVVSGTATLQWILCE